MSEPRLKMLSAYMVKNGMGAVVLNAGATLTYLSGLHFHLSERPIVMIFTPEHEPVIILPELEKIKLFTLQFPSQVFTYGENPQTWGESFQRAVGSLNLAGHKIGVDPRQMRLLEHNFLKLALPESAFVDGSSVFATIRSQKDANEIANIRKAVVIAENALESTLSMVKVGVSEKEIASELFMQLMRYGSEPTLPFSPIVAGGPNGANPHAQPSERKIQEGDLLVVDWGASYNGYASDLTRTFAVGKIDDEAKKIHSLVKEANRVGRAAGRPGVSCATVDKATRKCIEEGGYGKFFNHRTGHGLGMECHEDPYIRCDNEQLLQEGMVYTIEPGIYLAGKNGVRIEDDVVITKDGAKSLSTMSRDLRIIGT